MSGTKPGCNEGLEWHTYTSLQVVLQSDVDVENNSLLVCWPGELGKVKVGFEANIRPSGSIVQFQYQIRVYSGHLADGSVSFAQIA